MPHALVPANLLQSFVLLLFLQSSGANVSYSQSRTPTLRTVTELNSGRDARGMFSGDFNGDGRADLGTFGPTQVLFHLREKNGVDWRTVRISLENPVAGAGVGRCNADNADDLVILTDHPPGLGLFLGSRQGRYKQSWSAPLRRTFENIVCGDVNSDGIADVLLFGPKDLGVTVFPGTGKGVFGPDTLLFPEFSVNALKISDINEDGLNDIVVSNWVSSELLIFTAFGRMKFGEPLIINLPAEARCITTALIDGDEFIDLAVLTSDTSTCTLFAGDGLGGFQHLALVDLKDVASAMTLADLNEDKKPDLLLLNSTRPGLNVHLSGSDGTFGRGTTFTGGKRPTGMCVFAEGSPRVSSVALLDGESSTIRIFHNTKIRPKRGDEMLIATGTSPGAIEFVDVNRDTYPDIVVADREARQISLYLNRGDGEFEGQIAVGTSGAPSSLVHLSKSDTSAVFLTMPEDREELDFTEFQTRGFSQRSWTVPLQRPLELLGASLSASAGTLRLIAMERRSDAFSGTLIALEEIAAGRFREQVVTPPGAALMTASIKDLDHDGTPDLLCVVRDPVNRQLQLCRARGIPSGGFDTLRQVWALGIADSVPSEIWTGDLNGDSIPDLVLNLQMPFNELSVALGTRENAFLPISFRFKNPISVSSPEHLKITDLNGDGVNDIVLFNDLKREIQLYVGRGRGSFWPATRVASAEGIGGFAIGRLNNDIVPGLIMTDSVNNLLRIISLHER